MTVNMETFHVGEFCTCGSVMEGRLGATPYILAKLIEAFWQAHAGTGHRSTTRTAAKLAESTQ